MSFVLDSSMMLSWIYQDKTTDGVRAVFTRLTEAGCWVPGTWRSEVATVLDASCRKGLHDTTFRDATLADLKLLPIHVDPDTDRQAWTATLRLAERHRLTLYSATYLELAQRLGLPLATLDPQLRIAAAEEGLKLLGK